LFIYLPGSLLAMLLS